MLACMQCHLDASKAFPAAARPVLWSIMRSKGYPAFIVELMEELYTDAEVHFRVQGAYVAEEVAEMRRGIYQGCPLSVASFGCLLLPIVERHTSLLPPCWGVGVFADDLNVWSNDSLQLSLALKDIEEYFDMIKIVLNPSKTQCWSSDGTDPGLQPGGQQSYAEIGDQGARDKVHSRP